MAMTLIAAVVYPICFFAALDSGLTYGFTLWDKAFLAATLILSAAAWGPLIFRRPKNA